VLTANNYRPYRFEWAFDQKQNKCDKPGQARKVAFWAHSGLLEFAYTAINPA
jgi:hypothetical protein